ncbi:MAG: methyl-accepting chemotaxis protein [Negativicutes bacterium]|nr:methyl-accepting chemotaxis protein [Negativicutes bacterium]
MSIKKKLIMIMLLISFVPLVLLSAVSIRYLGKSLEEETITQCRQLVNEVKLQTDGYLDSILITIRTVAKNPSVKAMDMTQAKPYLVEIQKTSPPDVTFTIDDAKGNMIARGDNATLVNIADREFFKFAMTGNDAISEPIVSKISGKLTVNTGTPIRTGDSGVVVGVSQGSFTLAKISEFVAQLSANGNLAYIIDASGKVLAHPDENVVKERVDMSKMSFVQRGLAEKKSGYSVEDGPSGKKLVTYAYDSRTGWMICLEVPYSVITDKTQKLTLILGGLTMAVLVIVGFLVVVLARRFTAPIVSMQCQAERISQGDLTQKIDIASKDEIGLLGRALDAMVVNLKNLIGQVQRDAEQVSASSDQLTASAEQSAQAANQVAASITTVAQGADKQLGVVRDAAAVVEKMSESIRQVAANANTVSEQSARTAETAKEGGESIERAVRQMTGLEKTVSASAQVVTRLGERSKEIGQIIGTISGIAGQTNLLALNAAIEAARAGEQGRGFAVVAEEVRKLAEQSQEAAKQIENLIGQIQNETGKAVQAMDEGTREVKAGTGVVNEAGIAFQQIIGMVTQLSDQVGEISTAIQQLANGSQQIVTSVGEIDKLTKAATGETQTVSAATEEQSASMEEIASSSHSLAKMAENLQRAVGKFRS